ncbi:hypothetical protein G9A89_018420 [Geosiphon pyriformis]|nr:hypothetical protein G9A89_018420 [Geosiphon pyriformis]
MDKTTIESLYNTFRTSSMEIAFEHQKTSTDNTKPKVAESENIGANHLGFVKSLFQHYCQHLELNHNHISAKSVFNFYVNEKISFLLRTPVNTESARETFYRELIQNTNLPTNHNFVSIITEINKEIEHHTQQKYPITYANKGKRKLQTPANNPNPKLINQQNLPPVIVINQPPINPVAEPLQQPFQLPPQQPIQQQLLQQPPQQSNLDPMAYVPITKLDNFTGEEDDAQVWLNDTEFVRYFSNNNSINKLANLFTTIKQGDTEAVTTYLGCFHRNLHQIQAIQADYFTQVRLMHPVDLSTTITHARDFEAAELEANHAQAVNLVMNESSKLDSKLKQFIYQPQPPAIYQQQPPVIYQPQPQIIYQSQPSIQTPLQNSATMTSGNPKPRIAQNWRSAMVVHQPILSSSHQSSGSHSRNLSTGATQNLNSQNYLSLLVTPENAIPNNQELKQILTSNILPATITENKSLDAIFPFKLEESSIMSLFSGAALEEKPITTIYTDVKIDGHPIKLILDSGRQVDQTASARIIMANGVTKTPIGKINDLLIEINSIIVPIKVFVIEATQYQALVGNDWLSKTNTTLDWNTQELQLSQNRQHMRVPAMCGHFKATNTMAPLIDFEEEKPKPTWEAYQVLWADEEHNELPPILSWDDNGKGKQTNKLTCWEWNKDKGKGKKKEEGMPPTAAIYNFYTHHTPQQSNY